jgi:hypothetical protein
MHEHAQNNCDEAIWLAQPQMPQQCKQKDSKAERMKKFPA